MAKIYEAMQKMEKGSTASCLDLRNRKQTGDLEKKIFQLHQKNDSKIFHFTCSKGKEGVSTVIANLINYLKLQKNTKKILLIDGNMHNPRLHTYLAVHNKPGLADALENGGNIQELTIPLEGSSVDILTSGPGHRKHTDTLSQEKFSLILEECRNHYDYIFIDSTAMFASTDALSIAMASDVTFLVIQAFDVVKPVAVKAKAMLLDNECHIGGIIFNRVPQVIPAWFYKHL